MIRISLTDFYDLSLVFERLRRVQANARLNDVWSNLYDAELALQTLLAGQGVTVRTAYAPGQRLWQLLHTLTGVPPDDGARKLSLMEAANLGRALNEFETVLRAEFAAADAYFVTQKRGFDTLHLVANGEVLWPPDLPEKAPEAIADAREAGKCIAFELGTAAGFHILRATESVLLRYWKCVTNGKPIPANRNIGNYLTQLEKQGVGDAKIIAVLRQIKDLHRNELFHPEVTLTVQEAIELLGIAQSAVGAMLKPLPVAEHAVAEPPADVVDAPEPSATASGGGPEPSA